MSALDHNFCDRHKIHYFNVCQLCAGDFMNETPLASKAETPTPQNALLPCPFETPTDPHRREMTVSISEGGLRSSWIQCECGARGPTSFCNKPGEEWNKRATASPSFPAAGLPTGVAQQKIIRRAIKQIERCMCAGSDGRRKNLQIADQLREMIRPSTDSAPAAPPVIEEQKRDLE